MTLCLHVVPFLRYLASKNGVTLKQGVGVLQGHLKWRRSMECVDNFTYLGSVQSSDGYDLTSDVVLRLQRQ